jgi:rubredoxin
MNKIDLLVGIKAEQTLRDAVRDASEEAVHPADSPELCPIGAKDWIAGIRVDEPIQFGEVDKILQAVTKQLLDLGSHQRIRRESVRLYAVPKPVPVFKEPQPEEPVPETPIAPAEETDEVTDEVTCPACGAKVHKYNVRYDPWGQMIGCYFCRSKGGGPVG